MIVQKMCRKLCKLILGYKYNRLIPYSDLSDDKV